MLYRLELRRGCSTLWASDPQSHYDCRASWRRLVERGYPRDELFIVAVASEWVPSKKVDLSSFC
jgi:hypothetical protein